MPVGRALDCLLVLVHLFHLLSDVALIKVWRNA